VWETHWSNLSSYLQNGREDDYLQYAAALGGGQGSLFDAYVAVYRGVAQVRRNQFEDALASFDSILPLVAAHCAEGSSLRVLTDVWQGDAALELGQLPRALSALRRAWRSTGDYRSRYADTIAAKLVGALRLSNETGAAREIINEFLASDTRMTQSPAVLVEAARVEFEDANYAAARDILDHAAVLVDEQAPEFVDLQLERARLYRQAGDLGAARRIYDTLAESWRGQQIVPAIEMGRGMLAQNTGDYVAAKDYFTAAYGAMLGATTPNAAEYVTAVKHNLALSYSELDQRQLATRLFEETQETYRSNGQYVSLARSVLEHALMLVNGRQVSDQDAAEAMALAREAIAILDEHAPQRRQVRAFAQSSLGFALFHAGRYDESEAEFREVVTALTDIEGPMSFHLAPSYTKLAEIAYLRADYETALRHIDRALEIRGAVGSWTPRGLAQNLSVKARIVAALDGPEQALPIASRAVRVMEDRLRANLQSANSMAVGEQSRWNEVFATYLSLGFAASGETCVRHSDLGDDLLRAFQLAQLLNTGQSLMRRSTRDQALSSEIRTLLGELAEVRERAQFVDQRMAASAVLEVLADAQRRSLASQASALQERLDSLARSLREHGHEPEFRLLTVADVQAIVMPQELVLAFLVASDVTFRVEVTTLDFSICHLEHGEAELNAYVERVSESLQLSASGRPMRSFAWSDAKALSERLLEGTRVSDRDIEHVTIAPFGSLQRLSMAVLPLPGSFGSYLGLAKSLSYLPALSNVEAVRQVRADQPRPKGFLGMYGADRRLLSSVSSIATTLRGIEAHTMMLETALSSPEILQQQSVLMFATHGLTRSERNHEAGLMVHARADENIEILRDGLLGASEVYGLRFNADLVILNACSSASGDGTPGDVGFSGLTSAFLETGARSVLVSQWDVSVSSSQRLMKIIMERLDEGVARALREAMIELRREHWHPAHWAPFVVVGDGVRAIRL
jgi:tetratricopeptide (TPR) repeat protein